MTKSKIEWTNRAWNPVTGCEKVSPGCAHCYAEGIAVRFNRNGGSYLPGKAEIKLHPERLEQPLKWKPPQKIFVNSMSDLFHEAVPDEFIAKVFDIMCATPFHTYQILTKRPERMIDWFGKVKVVNGVSQTLVGAWDWPAENVWLGVSVENQHWADIRIPLLLQTPAAVRFVSYEPALKPVDFTGWDGVSQSIKHQSDTEHKSFAYGGGARCLIMDCHWHSKKLDWLIVGGESGPKARACQGGIQEVVRDTIAQCRAAGVAVFAKQMGTVWAQENTGKRDKGGDWDLWPEDLRVREYPEVSALAG